MHNATLDLQLGMRKMKRAYRDYYILKMDIRKYFNSIDKKILYKILKRRIFQISSTIYTGHKMISKNKKTKKEPISLGNEE